MATKTEILEGVAKLIDTESGVAELVTFLFQDEQTENLNRNQYQTFLGRVQSSWAKLEGAKKEAVAESIRRLMEMNGVTAADLGFGDGSKPKNKTPKKEGEAVKFVIWYRDAAGEVQTAHVGQKGGMNGEPKDFLVKHGDIKRTAVLVKGQNEAFADIGKHLTKEEFEAAYPA